MVRQATRYSVVAKHAEFIAQNPSVVSTVDSSIYFAKFQLHEPSDGNGHVKLGNWEEILSDEEKDAGVVPSRSSNDYDAGLYCKDLVKRADCTSNIRLAKINFGNWPIIVVANFMGEYFPISIVQHFILFLEFCPSNTILIRLLVLSSFAGEAFLETNRDELVNERLPYFGKAIVEHAHFKKWAKWAQAQGLPLVQGEHFGRKMKEYVKTLPTSRS